MLGAKESDLNKLSEDDLKVVLLEMGLETPKTKKEMIELIVKHTKNTRNRDHDSDGDDEIEADLNKSIEESKMEDKEEEENTNETLDKITDSKKSEEPNEIEDAEEEDITNKVEEESPEDVKPSPQQGEEEKEKEIQSTESPNKMEIVDDDIYASISAYVDADNLNDKFNEQDDEENKEKDKSDGNEDNIDENEKIKSCIIHVSGFVRPFSIQDAEELFSRCGGGSYNYYWMNRIKSNAYISYKTVADATRALKELDGMVLQNGSKSKLTAKFGDENVAIRAIQNDAKINRSPLAIKLLKEFKEKGLLLAPEQTSKKEEDTNKKESTKRIVNEDISSDDGDDKDIVTQPQKKKKKANTRLDELFMKTECEPHIYYLPLTDQELEERDKIRSEKRKERK